MLRLSFTQQLCNLALLEQHPCANDNICDASDVSVPFAGLRHLTTPTRRDRSSECSQTSRDSAPTQYSAYDALKAIAKECLKNKA